MSEDNKPTELVPQQIPVFQGTPFIKIVNGDGSVKTITPTRVDIKEEPK